jgi:hypothetical protein
MRLARVRLYREKQQIPSLPKELGWNEHALVITDALELGYAGPQAFR